MANVQYSRDLRERAVAAYRAGSSTAEIARMFGTSRRSVSRWIQWEQTRETLSNKPRQGRRPKIAVTDWAKLSAQVAAHPDATLAEHCHRWEATSGVRVSTATMSRYLGSLGWTLKKRPSSPGNRTSRSGPPFAPGAGPPPPTS